MPDSGTPYAAGTVRDEAEPEMILMGKGGVSSMLHLPRMKTGLTVVTALASRLTKKAGMKSYLAVPVDKEVKYESTSPPLSTSSFERLLASVPRVPECGAEQSRRHETLCKGRGQSADVGPWTGVKNSLQAYFIRRYAGPCC